MIYKKIFLCVCVLFFTGCFGSNPDSEEELIEIPSKSLKINFQRNNSAPTIVLDLDNTLCVSSSDTFSNDHKKWLKEKFPNVFSCCIEETYEEKTINWTYFFFPYYGEMILTLLSWGWNVDFFSAGLEKRNKVVIEKFLKDLLGKHSTEGEKAYELLINGGYFKIYSRHHMAGYEKYPNNPNYWKKDLTIIAEDISNIILVDDKKCIVVEDQKPFIEMSTIAAEIFLKYIEKPNFSFEKTLTNAEIESPLNNAVYILGILTNCRTIMLYQEISLRKALSKALGKKGNMNAAIKKGNEMIKETLDVLTNSKIKFFEEKFIEIVEEKLVDKNKEEDEEYEKKRNKEREEMNILFKEIMKDDAKSSLKKNEKESVCHLLFCKGCIIL